MEGGGRRRRERRQKWEIAEGHERYRIVPGPHARHARSESILASFVRGDRPPKGECIPHVLVWS